VPGARGSIGNGGTVTDGAATSRPARNGVRAAGRHDVPGLVDLRVRFLGERARLTKKPGIPPDVRARNEALLPVWLGQEERVLLVAAGGLAGGAPDALHGYALGLVSQWPPLFRRTRVGEVQEVYVEPAARGQGLGRMLLTVLTEVLLARGVEVLRAPVAVEDASSLARFEAQGYRPWQQVLERRQDGP
jgi:GNAT superfamily N-acetyltransferase